ncbi:MAG: RHS repeat-associated core domain-containing protein [Bacteroidales bacterium]|nr:RHS repeat-associated core domain-containing protein [Bacteroidales bacterium]
MSKKLLYTLNTTTPDAASPTIHYELTNHLGNVMAVITDEPAATETPAVESLTDYYPFGMTMPGRSYNAHTSRHGFTGHEKESDLAEGIYTTQYRLYDAREGRWLSVDPLFEKYVSMSPYQYCHNNPINRVDIDGRFDTEDEATQFIWDNEINGRVTQRSDGTYEIYDELSRETYYHDSQGTLNTNLQEFTVEAKRGKSKAAEPTFFDKVANGYVNMMERGDNWANGFGAAIGNYLFYSDAYSLYLGGTAAMGPGVSASIEVGYMKGEGNGWFGALSVGFGAGVDFSAGGGLKFSNYSGVQTMTIDSYKGEGTSYAGGVFLLDFGYSISKDNNWNSVNVGASGSPLQGSGTITHTQTYIP